MATIKQIDGRSVHQIQSGQVIVDLCSVVKELVENSVDAGATTIDVRFKNQGLDLIEVQDNGSGISPPNYPSIALKHYTSKLSSYSDISSLQTFGFRGEALASLCALSVLTATTCLTQDVPKGSKLTFEPSGKLKDTSVVAAQRGTTVSVESLFHNLPVRRRELERNIKREWQKVISLLNQYACIQTKLKFSVSHQPTKGKRILLFSTKGNSSTRENIINIFGAKTMTALVPLDLSMEIRPSTTRPLAHVVSDPSSTSKEVRVVGHVSRPFHGEGRQTPDRQMFFVNGRPCALPQFAKAFNEVYRSYNSSQSPFILADIRLDTDLYDVNVSPDKRSILLHDQNHLLDNLRSSLVDLFDAHDYSLPISQPLCFSKTTPRRPDSLGNTTISPLEKQEEQRDSVPQSSCESDKMSDDDLEQSDENRQSFRDGAEYQKSTPVRPHVTKQANQSLLAMFARQKDGATQRLGSSPSNAPIGGPTSLDVLNPGGRSPLIHAAESDTAQSLSSENAAHEVPHLKSGLHGPRSTLSSPPRSLHTTADQLSDIELDARVDDGTTRKGSSLPSRSQEVKSQSLNEMHIGRNESQITRASIMAKTGEKEEKEVEEEEEPQRQSKRLKTASNEVNGQESLPHIISDSRRLPRPAIETLMPVTQSSPRRKDATTHLVQHLSVTEQILRSRMLNGAVRTPRRGPAHGDARHVEAIDAADAEHKLPLIIAKSDFAQMRVAGQFNLGFIIALRPANIKRDDQGDDGGNLTHDELFIIDQHASDEKYNFERLQKSTVMQTQRLVHPKRLQLTALEEEILLQHTPAIEANGFKVDIDTTGRQPVGSRCQLMALPLSRETTFGLEDLEELISLLGDNPSDSSRVPRPSKVRKMLAMRACRSSVMIGKALTCGQMYGLVKHMGELDKPWNCPHGRPTMRHLTRLSSWDGTSWSEDLDHSTVDTWKDYVQDTP